VVEKGRCSLRSFGNWEGRSTCNGYFLPGSVYHAREEAKRKLVESYIATGSISKPHGM